MLAYEAMCLISHSAFCVDFKPLVVQSLISVHAAKYIASPQECS